ncbi:MAG: F0F1 ATP synthase subunit delta [Steroidobacteraceae bacterium]|nr:F0F1 ATP synthase subunit delta [Steroidobacteraceae bacterium]MDW8257941.1 F0F1 ATP synthase subunit delta [Gammaproteobacteria bacterium]
MAELATIARPYARAAFDHARRADALSAWSAFLATAAAAVKDARFASLIGSPRVSPVQLAQFLLDIAGGAAPANADNFLRLLAENRRLPLLPLIAAQFEALRSDAEGIADVNLTSAVALTDEQRAKFVAALQKRLQRSVRLHCAVDPNLVGGAIVQCGDFVIDGSLRGRLERLATQMVN